MRMNNLFFLTSLLMILLTSCDNFSTGSKQDAIPDIHSGIAGISIEFVKNAPPPLMFEYSPFPIIVKAKNTGAHDITMDVPAVVSLGIERDYHSLLLLETSDESRVKSDGSSWPNKALFSIAGKSYVNTKGDEELLSYTLTAGQIDAQSETHTSTAIATLCYPYKTELTSSICVDTDPLDQLSIKKSCSMENLAFADGQGAPVAITAIETVMMPSIDSNTVTPQFMVTIENRGDGEVTHIDSYRDMCGFREDSQSSFTYKDFNALRMRAYLSSDPLSCSLRAEQGAEEPSIVRLREKKDVVRCIASPIDVSRGSFTAPLRIELDYGYTTSISTQYTIKKPVR